jgi:hypothetical protein
MFDEGAKQDLAHEMRWQRLDVGVGCRALNHTGHDDLGLSQLFSTDAMNEQPRAH